MRSRIALWRQVPPAIFPVCLGFVGIALAWKSAARLIDFPQPIADLFLGAVTAFFLYFSLAYGAKVIARPAALAEDLATAPGRAGLSALAMTLMLFSLVMQAQGVSGAPFWFLGIVLHICMSISAIFKLVTGGQQARQVSPFQYLTFVGLIVAPVAGTSLGYGALSLVLAMFSLVPFAIITVLFARQLLVALPPPPMRAPIVIVLAPVGLFAIAFAHANMGGLFDAFYWAATALALLFLSLGVWLAKSGFVAPWGSFTFPIAVFTNMNLLAMSHSPTGFAYFGALVGLIIGTPIVLYVVARTFLAFVRGDLQKMTGAATA